jgi:hypothetical protein
VRPRMCVAQSSRFVTWPHHPRVMTTRIFRAARMCKVPA